MWGGVIAVAALAGLLVWLLRGRHAPPRPREPEDGLSYEELEARRELREAEQEVQQRGSAVEPDEEQAGDDWGPGVPRSY